MAQTSNPRHRPGPGVLNLVVVLRRCCTHVSVLFAFLVLTLFHLRPIGRLSSGLYGGVEDAWMNVFHVWWMRQAFLEGLWPWHTPYLHAPQGADMYWHTLAPIKHVWGVVLLPFLDAVTAYNALIVATFVASGYAMWLLCGYLCRRAGAAPLLADAAGFVGACVFAFSPYHIAHAAGHMNLISIEGIPIFLLSYLRFRDEGGRAWLFGIGLAGLYVILSDYYYFIYLVLFMAGDTAYLLWSRPDPASEGVLLRDRSMRRIVQAFVSMTVFASPVLSLLLAHAFPAPVGVYHGDSDYFTHLIGLFLPGQFSLWYRDMPFLSSVVPPVNHEESGTYLGWFVGILAGCAVWLNLREARRFAWIGVSFAILSLGGFLSVFGTIGLRVATVCLVALPLVVWLSVTTRRRWLGLCAVFLLVIAAVDIVAPFTYMSRVATLQVPLPYLIFKHLFPFYERGGYATRFLLMTYLSLGVCVSMAVAWAARRKPCGLHAAEIVLLSCLLVNAEYAATAGAMVPVDPLPRPIVDRIRSEPDDVAILTDDAVRSEFDVIFHGRPVSAARLSRVPPGEWKEHQSMLFRAVEAGVLPHPTAPERASMLSYIRTHRFKYAMIHGPTSAKDAFILHILSGALIHGGPGMRVYSLYE